jgi:hypothetical protein
LNERSGGERSRQNPIGRRQVGCQRLFHQDRNTSSEGGARDLLVMNGRNRHDQSVDAVQEIVQARPERNPQLPAHGFGADRIHVVDARHDHAIESGEDACVVEAQGAYAHDPDAGVFHGTHTCHHLG